MGFRSTSAASSRNPSPTILSRHRSPPPPLADQIVSPAFALTNPSSISRLSLMEQNDTGFHSTSTASSWNPSPTIPSHHHSLPSTTSRSKTLAASPSTTSHSNLSGKAVTHHGFILTSGGDDEDLLHHLGADVRVDHGAGRGLSSQTTCIGEDGEEEGGAGDHETHEGGNGERGSLEGRSEMERGYGAWGRVVVVLKGRNRGGEKHPEKRKKTIDSLIHDHIGDRLTRTEI